ncbi:hypothetical protein KMD03_gp10 [Lactococcus phage CHPC1183]|uniref:Uncharacterized protein n=1 Tax=Lactococcus phage CHPC1183 TaxID=2675243 RepID=A0A650ERP5_9CAUD|nr:hypothetical protein [Bacillus altitudinis]YP_010081383.1 hypothetical protein KMD03_gp10 [Lactococcus phage CHPC1183]PYH22615.1 hypothetical protein US8_02757 [Bacillus altitudinis]QGT52660.1 hypothetical protein CHPC1183_000314 [Lactococcus phage CHPC1183]
MALTIKQLIEKLERVEDKSGDVYIEFPGEYLTVDTVLLDDEGDINLINEKASHHCDCQKCKTSETEL